MTTTGKIILTVFIILVFLLFAVLGITAYFGYVYYQEYQDMPQVSDGAIEWEPASKMEKFTDKEFEDFESAARPVSALEEKGSSFIDDIGLGDVTMDSVEEAPLMAGSPEGLGAAPEDESITNVQEQGVDEGDIVKSYGDYLVILRRGRLFTVKLKENGEDLLKPVFKSEAYPAGSTLGTYYDEMLISDDNIIVIGYSYSMEATEIGLFKIDDQGTITHENTYFMDSNDYYSSRNYASRLVDGKLIFYMPLYLNTWDYDTGEYDAHLPEIKKWISGSEVGPGKQILSPEDIYKPIQEVENPTLHTVVSCDLASNDFDCNAQAVLGPYARNFYVSSETVYVWVSDNDYFYYDYDANKGEPNAHIYAMPLDLSEVTAVQAYGAPIDQFSFKETEDNLNVMVRDEGFGDAMWNAEYSDSDLSFVQIPLEDFTASIGKVDTNDYFVLPVPDGYTLVNRYVGDYLLYGSGDLWWEDNYAGDSVYVMNYTQKDKKVQEVELGSTVDRIEVLDNNNAVVIGGKGNDLLFNWVALSDNPTKDNTYTMADAVEGETRSHGFFYSAAEGVLGLPTRSSGEGVSQLWEESNGVKFLEVNTNSNSFKDLGSLDAPPEEERDLDLDIDEYDNCEYSCEDWYGNSRPIFYLDRIFALMGYDLVEGEVQNGAMKEIRSTDYLEVQ
ncbi:MAG: beta-propeller domain-containing protein [Patescibacteria group bacterium]